MVRCERVKGPPVNGMRHTSIPSASWLSLNSTNVHYVGTERVRDIVRVEGPLKWFRVGNKREELDNEGVE